jgi:hypothetical protein
MEVTGPAGLTSRRCPVRAWRSRLSSLRGLRRPLSRVWRIGRTGVVAQCHGIVAGHAAQRHIVAGMASPGELAEQCQGVIPRCVVVWIRL